MKSRILKVNREQNIIWDIGTYFNAIILTYLFVRLILYHETQPKELKNLFFWKEINPFCWVIFITKVLPKNQFPFPTLSIFAFQSTQQSIYRHRRNAGINLPYLFRPRKDRNNTSLKTEWSLSIPYRITYLSQSNYLETFSSSNGTLGLIQIQKASRPFSVSHGSQTQVSHQGHLRFGLHRPYPLWQTGDGSDRLQSQKVGPSFLSSAPLFQRDHQRFLAWRTSPRRYPYWNGSHRTPEGFFCQTAPSVKNVTIRANKGFYDHETIEYLESKRALFVIVAKLTAPIKREISSLSYQVHSSGLETAEFMYQPMRWKRKYRFVVVKRLVPEDPTEQLTLFSMGKYTYQVLVTNMKLTPLNIWRFYNGRAAVELIIKELKGDYPLGKIPTKHFAANEAYFHTLLFSYNLINWFKRLSLPKEFQNMTLNTLRNRLLVIPGELTRPDNKPTLKLPANFLYKDASEYAIKKIDKLRI